MDLPIENQQARQYIYSETNNGKDHQHKIEIELLSINLQQAFDSIKKRILKKTSKELGVQALECKKRRS